MKNAQRWAIIVSTIGLSVAGACGGPSSRDVEETSELRHGHGFSVSACCRRAYPPGWRRGHCIAEAMREHGICAHPDKGDAGACGGGPGGSGGAGGGGPSDAGMDAATNPAPQVTHDEARFLADNPIISIEPFTTFMTFPPPQKTVVFQQVRYTSVPSADPYWVVADGPSVGAHLYRMFSSGSSGFDVLIDFEGRAFATAFGFRLVAFGVPNQFVLVIEGKDGVHTTVDLPYSVANTYVGIAGPNGVRSVTISQRGDQAGGGTTNFAFGSAARTALYTDDGGVSTDASVDARDGSTDSGQDAPDASDVPVCGNHIVEQGEECDPPDSVTCSSFCHFLPRCGNGVIDPGEQCDPPRSTGAYPRCDPNCQIPVCGNLQIDPGEQCDPPMMLPGVAGWCDQSCQRPTCGNGLIDPGENCDPPSGGWLPGHGTPLYCGYDCTNHDACAECHQRCDSDPRGFEACKCQYCVLGPYGPCGGCAL